MAELTSLLRENVRKGRKRHGRTRVEKRSTLHCEQPASGRPQRSQEEAAAEAETGFFAVLCSRPCSWLCSHRLPQSGTVSPCCLDKKRANAVVNGRKSGGSKVGVGIERSSGTQRTTSMKQILGEKETLLSTAREVTKGENYTKRTLRNWSSVEYEKRCDSLNRLCTFTSCSVRLQR